MCLTRIVCRFICLLGLSAIFVGCSTGSYNSGMNAAIAGESSAKLGVRYLLGRGVPQNDATAFSYFLKGANDGDPFAANEVAFMYAAGKGTSQDYSKAVYWYQQAANHDLASAQFNLGLLYKYGLGVERNPSLAHQWISKAASHGFEPARVELAKS